MTSTRGWVKLRCADLWVVAIYLHKNPTLDHVRQGRCVAHGGMGHFEHWNVSETSGS